MLGMLGLVLMLGVGFVALYLFNTTQHDVALRGEGGFLERLHLPSTLHEEEGYAPYIPAPRRARPGPVLPSFRESFAGPITGECARGSVKWQTCDAGVCSHNHLALVPGFDSLFVRTAAGERTTEFVHRVLVKAWGSEPPMIDLYVRAGCRGALELGYLFHTVVRFYPRFLGDLIIVLDANDQTKVDAIVPRALLQNYSVHVVYEHQPCFPGRLFNQYAYLNLYKHSQAEFVVTIDSDVAFHRPVTPDVLFNRKGELILPTSREFQRTFWYDKQFFFTRIDDRTWGHSMVTQPLSFRVDSFPAYFAYINATRSVCYERLMVDFYQTYHPYVNFFCWMCQLSAYIKAKRGAGYEVRVVEDEHDNGPFLRFAAHVTYERGGSATTYHDAVKRSTVQGLCFWFGKTVFADDCEEGDGAYLRKLIFTYAGYDMNRQFTFAQRQLALSQAKTRLQAVM
ncbi:hypothetical protein BASA82_000211 [Batrachochytrium salamandrivorans]|nr:hypothetical protein BASA82_000211 [Batrachochytrium salamandrivorans]